LLLTGLKMHHASLKIKSNACNNALRRFSNQLNACEQLWSSQKKTEIAPHFQEQAGDLTASII